jgi:hypothetical protein
VLLRSRNLGDCACQLANRNQVLNVRKGAKNEQANQHPSACSVHQYYYYVHVQPRCSCVTCTCDSLHRNTKSTESCRSTVETRIRRAVCGSMFLTTHTSVDLLRKHSAYAQGGSSMSASVCQQTLSLWFVGRQLYYVPRLS